MKGAGGRENRQFRLSVDLTPVLPGGENGGARNWALDLVEGLAEACPTWDLQLLTRRLNHETLAFLEEWPNINRVLTDAGDPAPAEKSPGLARRLFQRLPARVRRRLYGPWDRLRPLRSVPTSAAADLILCPFTAPFFWKSGQACVSLVHDLQYQDYPQFFSEDERAERHRHLDLACRRSDRLVVASQFVAGTLELAFETTREKIRVIPIRPQLRQPGDTAQVVDHLSSLKLRQQEYFLYPANHWPHKNHRILLTAFAIFCSQQTKPSPKLVLTGHPLDRGLLQEIRGLGLEEEVILSGYVPDQFLTDLLSGALAMVYPSLYEGFGIPLVEAMALGVPVLAGNRAAVPETCDGAALLVDPRKPFEIVQALSRVWHEPNLRSRLREAGLARVQRLGGRERMVEDFKRLFREIVESHDL